MKKVLNDDLPFCDITRSPYIQPQLHTRRIVYDFLRSKKAMDIKGSIMSDRIITT